MSRLFAATVFLAAALLFLVQPMVARMVLPRFGGGPAVWTTCMVFFQAALLGGYLYAHLGATRLSSRRLIIVHLVLLLVAALALPIAVPSGWLPPAEGDPIPSLLGAVAVAAGLPFFVISASTPLLQRWYVDAAGASGRDPYLLYAASNAGSLLGLIAYPVLVEPQFGIRDQGIAWSAGYVALIALSATCGWRAWKSNYGPTDEPRRAAAAPPLNWRVRLGWVSLALVPSSLMLSVTAALSTDIPPVPMLWAAPLALYLLTFVIAFGCPADRLRWAAWGPAVAVGLEAAAMYWMTGSAPPLLGALALHLAAFAAVALGCHAEVAATRPPAGRTTEFYLCLSVGGVLGGLVNAIVAPAVFDSVAEFPLGLAAAAVVIPVTRAAVRGVAWKPLLAAGGAAAAGLLIATVTVTSGMRVIYQERSFFGVSRVILGQNENTHQLMHGAVEHGAQVLNSDPARRIAPLIYYHPDGPIGQLFQARMKARDDTPVGVVGLGCGSLAYYWRKDQPFVFFEIDPAVIRIARNPALFTFLRDSKARCEIVSGDARRSLEAEPDGRFGLLVIDAFSGDAIPVHLLTTEAVELYRRKLAPGGVIAFHISNNHFELEPVLAAISARLELFGVSRRDRGTDLTEADRRRGRVPCHWLLLAPTADGLRWIADDRRWKPLSSRAGQRAWTDDHANVLGALRAFEHSP